MQSRASPDVKSQQQAQSYQQQPHSLPMSSAGDHGDFNNGSSGGASNRGGVAVPPQPTTSQAHPPMEMHALKLRRALQQKELEQADRNNAARMAGAQRPSSPREKLGLQGCPFDYVKNKIAEVMHRASNDDGNKSSANNNHGGGGDRSEDSGNGEQSNQPTYLPAANYAYPYSALNINSQVPVSAHSTPTAPPKPVDVPEPTPILSAQYEPLSDED